MKAETVILLPQLTWLRGIAALFVLMSHLYRANETSYSGEIKQQLWQVNWGGLGNFGVVLFFTLSGCTLYLSVAKQGLPDGASWWQFYQKRFFRVWPVFVIALFTYIIAGEMLHHALSPFQDSWLADQFLKPYELQDIFSYLLFIFNFTGPYGLFNNAFWSLPVEFQYYLLLPLLVVLLHRYGVLALLVAILLSHFMYKINFSFIDSSLLFRLFFTFAAGIYAGYLYQQSRIRLSAWLTLPALCGLTAAVLLLSDDKLKSWPLPSEWIIYGAIAVCCVILVVLTPLRLPRMIDKIFRFYGDISYSLYLFHNLVIALVVLIFVQYAEWLAPYKLFFLLTASFLLSTVLAWCCYKYLELPFIRIGRNLGRKQSL